MINDIISHNRKFRQKPADISQAQVQRHPRGIHNSMVSNDRARCFCHQGTVARRHSQIGRFPEDGHRQ